MNENHEAQSEEVAITVETTKLNVWTKIWRQPSDIFKQMREHYSWRDFYLILLVYSLIIVLMGVAESYFFPGAGEGAKSLKHGEQFNMSGMVALFAVLGAVAFYVLMIVGVFINAGFIKMTGGWLGGTASYKDICLVAVICLVPHAEISLIQAIFTVFFGMMIGADITHPASMANLGIFSFVTGLLGFAAAIFVLVVNSRGLAIIQGYASAWRGFGNLLLAGLMMGIVSALIGIAAAILLASVAG